MSYWTFILRSFNIFHNVANFFLEKRDKRSIILTVVSDRFAKCLQIVKGGKCQNKNFNFHGL